MSTFLPLFDPFWMEKLKDCVFAAFNTPCCAVLIVWKGKVIYKIELAAEAERRKFLLKIPDMIGSFHRPPTVLRKQIRRHLSGKGIPDYSAVKLNEEIGTPFERAVWNTVRKIPYGQTRTYGWVAAETGKRKRARAVGQAMANNPFPLVVPCHRVVASDGSLGGFSGGLELKKALLDLERAVARRELPASAQLWHPDD